MQRDAFDLKWEKDYKFDLLEQLEHQFELAVWEEAVTLYEAALERQPDNPEYLFFHGRLLEMKANRMLRQAAQSYEAALRSDSVKGDYSWIGGKLNAQLIKVRGQLSENRKSIDYYKKQLSLCPDDPRLYCYLTQCYLTVDQIPEAQQVVEAGLKLFPDYALLVYYAGETHSRLGHTEKALQEWERSASLDPQLIDGRFSRAFLLEREHRLEEAVTEWRRIADFMERHGFHEDVAKREIERIGKRLTGG